MSSLSQIYIVFKGSKCFIPERVFAVVGFWFFWYHLSQDIFFPALAFLCCFSEDTKDPFPFLTGPQHLVCHLQSDFCFKTHHRKRLSAPSVRACPVLLPFEIVSLHSKARRELVSFLRQGLQVCATTPARACLL